MVTVPATEQGSLRALLREGLRLRAVNVLALGTLSLRASTHLPLVRVPLALKSTHSGF